MKYHDNILCLEYDEVVPLVLKIDNYNHHRRAGNIKTIGKGGNGRETWIIYEDLSPKIKEAVLKHYGNPYEYITKQPILNYVKLNLDYEALNFYTHTYKLPSGQPLPVEPINYRMKYTDACTWLNAITYYTNDKRALKRDLNISLGTFWSMVSELINTHNIAIPTSDKRLKAKLKEYEEKGPVCLIEVWRFSNNNTKKVNEAIEKCILSLYAQDEKPYVVDIYHQLEKIRQGTLQLVDHSTGELFDHTIFAKENGKPITISLATVKNVINRPLNKVAVSKLRESALAHRSKHTPHAHRLAPQFSFSKITMDDISLPFKLADNTRVWAYQIFDVASGAVIACYYGKDKNQELFKNAVRDMVANVVKNGWCMPAEIEIEQHISSTLKGKADDDGVFQADILTTGAMFPFVRFCRGANPQEKRAEGFIRRKKFGVQNKRAGFQRRPFARLEANRGNEDKINKIRYTYEEVIANETEDIKTYNDQLHPKQDLYPGLTRWEVLQQQQNPNLALPDLASISKFIGDKSQSKIERSQFIKVKGKKYALPEGILKMVTGLTLDAYFMPMNGKIKEVYLYDGAKYICTCERLTAFQEAAAEKTADDERIAGKQFNYIKKHEETVKNKISDFITLKASPQPSTQERVLVLPRSKAFDAPIADEVEEDFDWRKHM